MLQPPSSSSPQTKTLSLSLSLSLSLCLGVCVCVKCQDERTREWKWKASVLSLGTKPKQSQGRRKDREKPYRSETPNSLAPPSLLAPLPSRQLARDSGHQITQPRYHRKARETFYRSPCLSHPPLSLFVLKTPPKRPSFTFTPRASRATEQVWRARRSLCCFCSRPFRFRVRGNARRVEGGGAAVCLSPASLEVRLRLLFATRRGRPSIIIIIIIINSSSSSSSSIVTTSVREGGS